MKRNTATLVERITDAFIALDKNFCYTYLNTQAGELVHKDPAELIGKKVWDVP
jgi:PAS domain-containing protein